MYTKNDVLHYDHGWRHTSVHVWLCPTMPYTANIRGGEIFMVGIENEHSWANFAVAVSINNESLVNYLL